MSYPIAKIRDDFPVLGERVNGQPLVYLDSAASAQKPISVIERVKCFDQQQYASVHRGIHQLSANATEMMETVRDQVASFINASCREEIVFVKGATEAINLVANSYGSAFFKPGDEVIISEMEHHANIVPWQLMEQQLDIKVRVWEVDQQGQLDLARLKFLLNDKTALVAITHISNVLGTVNPIEQIVALARDAGAVILVDGAQAVMHQVVDVQALDCDFYVFSAHKLYGPTGVGVLYGKKALLDSMPPWQGGGAMIRQVSFSTGTQFNTVPWRFEPGTPNITGIIGFGAALEYLGSIGLKQIQQYETALMSYALEAMKSVPDLHIYGPEQKAGVIAFNLGSFHAFDVGSFLDKYGIAIRTGHHCAMPLMELYSVSAMCRASIALYSQREDIDRLVDGLIRIHKLLNL